MTSSHEVMVATEIRARRRRSGRAYPTTRPDEIGQ
jgi:hypothetical protein